MWSESDVFILSKIKPDIVLFVGDISEGNIKTLKKINTLKIPAYVVLGNHDRGHDKSGETLLKQIRILQDKFCGWQLKVFNNRLNILGARPCSSGGGYFLSKEMKGVYGPLSEEDSTRRIIKCSSEARDDLPLLIIAHSGPSGLGSEPNSICGKDWKAPSMDWGDRDLSAAISHIQKNRFLDLVIFGHTHNELKRNLGTRNMFIQDKKGTTYLNAAIVPRYKKSDQGEILINFSWIEFYKNKLKYISQRWYTSSGEIVSENVLYEVPNI
tara:strand:- start:418 stop:1224 length:807 start_codon:yes stop_codon:yes gene_type:complete